MQQFEMQQFEKELQASVADGNFKRGERAAEGWDEVVRMVGYL